MDLKSADIPLPDGEEMMYFCPAWITSSELEYTHPPIYSIWPCSGVKGHTHFKFLQLVVGHDV